MKLNRTQFSQYTAMAGRGCVVLCCFFLPFSTSLSGTTGILATVFWLLSGEFLKLPGQLVAHRPLQYAMLLLLLLCLGMTYTPVPFDEALSFLKKYRELLYLGVVVGLLWGHSAIAKKAEYGFIAGCTVLMLISYAIYFQLMPSERYGYSIVYHITHSFFMAILAFWCLQKFLDREHFTIAWLVVFLLATINLFYIAPGRTGMLVYVMLLLLLFVQRLSPKYCCAALVAGLCLVTATFYTSQNFSKRVLEAVNEIEHYQAEQSRTSLGMRFDWWQNAVDMIKTRPLYGYGTGSFKNVQQTLIKDSETQPSDNPHNEYLLLSVQVGLPGGILFVALLASLFREARNLPTRRGYLLQGVVIAMATGCLMNSLLFDSLQGHFFAFLSAVLYNPQPPISSATPDS